MQAIQGNRSAIDQIANALNCTTTQLQSAICNVQGAIDKVAGQVGMTSQAVINAVQQQGCEIGNQISSCCCNLSSLINQSTCQTQQMINNQGYENRLETLNQTNTLQNTINQGLTNNREQATSRFNILSAKIDAQTTLINDKFCQLEMHFKYIRWIRPMFRCSGWGMWLTCPSLGSSNPRWVRWGNISNYRIG